MPCAEDNPNPSPARARNLRRNATVMRSLVEWCNKSQAAAFLFAQIA